MQLSVEDNLITSLASIRLVFILSFNDCLNRLPNAEEFNGAVHRQQFYQRLEGSQAPA